jgi:uncharacterized protein YwgA
MTIDVPSLIEAADGEIVGKVRLQKIVYLLEQLGVPTGFSFSYHHYGPYSDELADTVEDDVIFRRVDAVHKRRADGVPYVVYRALGESSGAANKSAFEAPQIKAALKAMQLCSATVLELAATIHWLAFVEKVENWQTELVRRKGIKTEQGRDKKAMDLLRQLQIAPV